MVEDASLDDNEGRKTEISGLKRVSLLLELITFAGVVLLSPISFVLGIPFGITPEVWLRFWLRYVAIFVVAALLVTLLGLTASSSYWVKAESIRKGKK
jgi:hypothetical protein